MLHRFTVRLNSVFASGLTLASLSGLDRFLQSVIIGNNDFSNIEKIAISTSTTVVGQNVGEYIFWDKNNVNGSGVFDDIGADFKNTLQGVICY